MDGLTSIAESRVNKDPVNQAIGNIVGKARERAATLVQMQNPAIIQQAMQAKRDLLLNRRAAVAH